MQCITCQSAERVHHARHEARPARGFPIFFLPGQSIDRAVPAGGHVVAWHRRWEARAGRTQLHVRTTVRPILAASAASARNKPLPVLYGGDAATRNTTITPPPPPMQASEAHQGIRSPNLRANRANAPAGGASPPRVATRARAANQPANQRRGGWGGVVAATLPPHACARGAGGGGPG